MKPTSAAVILALFAAHASAFQPPSPASKFIGRPAAAASASLSPRRPSAPLFSTEDDGSFAEAAAESTSDVETFLSQAFPEFLSSLLSKDEEALKAIRLATTAGPEGGCTVFAPNADAFASLSDRQGRQITDPRNLETTQKMAKYHVVTGEAVSSRTLKTEDWKGPKPTGGAPRPLVIGGVVTLGGEVPVGRAKSGGFLGIGAKEDGRIVVGPEAIVMKSFEIGNSVVHEVDNFISPRILWRYFDQLQIPGTGGN